MEESERHWDWGQGGTLRDFFHRVWDSFLEDWFWIGDRKSTEARRPSDISGDRDTHGTRAAGVTFTEDTLPPPEIQ
jgi:hypothetical protein